MVLLAAASGAWAGDAPLASGPVNASYVKALPLSALVDTLSLEKLSNVVVTDTKIAQPQDRVTQKIEVVTAAEFDQRVLPRRNLAELLAPVSGQFVNVLSRNDANWGSYSGLGPRYNTWLLDGVPIDSFVDGMGLPLWAIERIEVHKGNASVLYSNYLTMDFAGNETPLAGTTNFILKDRVDRPETRFQLGAGSYGTVRGQVFRQDRQGDFSYFLGTTAERADYTNYGSADSWLNILDSPGYRKGQVYGKFSYRLGRDDHTLSAFFNRTWHEGDVGRPERDFHHRYDTLNFAYNNQLTDTLHLQAKYGRRDYRRRWGEDHYPRSLALREHDGVNQRINLADLTLSWQHAPTALLTLGGAYQSADFANTSETIGTTTVNDVSAYSMAVYVQEKIMLDRWVLRAGGRLDRTRHDYRRLGGALPAKRDNAWNKALWSIGARFNAEGPWALYANAGNSFVAPSAAQLGGTLAADDAGIQGRNGRLPNFGLQPETGVGGDIGVDFRPLPTLDLGVRAFYNRVGDAIIDTIVSASPSQSQSQNAGRSHARGLEINARQLVSERFQWFANVTWTRSRVASASPDENGAAVPFAPDRIANAGFTLQLPHETTFSPYLHWTGAYYDSTARAARQRFGSELTIHARVQTVLERNSRYALIFALDLANLTNRRYSMPWGFRDPGFNAFASIQLAY